MIIALLLFFLFVAIIAAIFSVNALINTFRFGLPFVTTPGWAIDWLAKNLELNSEDTVFELGCGDARFLATMAVQHPTTKFIGIEIQWWPWLLAKWRVRNLPNVKILLGDFLKQDLTSATVVYGFFITVMMPKVADKLQDSLKAGSQVVSFGFALPGWQPVREVPPPEGRRGSKIRFYKK